MRFCISYREGKDVDKVCEFIKKSLTKEGLVYDEINPEIVVSVGGDGTFLRAIQKYFLLDPLFANINFGNLGYLCEYTNEELNEFVHDLLHAKHQEKKITLLEAKYEDKTRYALNEFRVEASKGDTLVFDVFINDTLELLGDLTTPLSMLIIGSMLCESPAKECFFNKKLYLIVFIRLIFIPICIYFILKGIINDKLLLSIPVILTSMPIATNAAIMANKYKANESLASQLVFLSALLSIITIPFISFLFIR